MRTPRYRFFSDTVLDLLTSHSSKISGLVMVLIFSVIAPQLATKVTDEDISLGPFTSPYAVVVQALLDHLFNYINTVLPLLLQDIDTFEAIMIRVKV